MTSSHFVIFLRGVFCEYLQVWNSFLVILVSPRLACLNFLELFLPRFGVFEFPGIVRIVFSCYGIGLNMLCLLILFLDPAQTCRACFRFCFVLLWILCLSFYHWSRAVSFIVLFLLFWFVGTWLLFQGPWRCIFVFLGFRSCILMWSWTNSYGQLTGYIT